MAQSLKKRHLPLVALLTWALLSPRSLVTVVLTLTAADDWYPPVRAMADPTDSLTFWVGAVAVIGLFVLIPVGICVLAFRVFEGRRVRSFGRESATVSWADNYRSLRASLIRSLKGAGFATEEAEAVLDRPFAMRHEPRWYLTRNVEDRKAMRAYASLTHSEHRPSWVPVVGSRHLSPDDYRFALLRHALVTAVVIGMDERNEGKVRWSIQTPVPDGLDATAAAAMRHYLDGHGYAGTSVVLRPQPLRSENGNVLASQHPGAGYPGALGPVEPTSMVTLLYSEPVDADRELSALSLIAAASPLGRVPLSTSAETLASARGLLAHWADLLSLRGYAPEEFADADGFTGIVGAETLARWAVHEVVLDGEPGPVIGTQFPASAVMV